VRCNVTSLRSHLPTSNMTECSAGQVIYGANNPSKSIYLVVTGMVEISRLIEGASGALLEIVLPEELFGESAFLGGPCRSEQATALENATLMTWTISEMENLVMRQPELAIALLQYFAQRNAEVTRRIESLSLDTIEQRLARSLIRLSERLGTPAGDGSIQMMPLTIEMLSRYVGTSHETTVHYMNRFREQGYVSHSRRGIVLYRDLFQKLLSQTAKKSRLRGRV
jgi:CRP-like cAMP-binding protein